MIWAGFKAPKFGHRAIIDSSTDSIMDQSNMESKVRSSVEVWTKLSHDATGQDPKHNS